MPAWFPIGRDRNPIRMRGVDVIASGVRIGARDHVHAERPAPGHQRAEGIDVLERIEADPAALIGRVVAQRMRDKADPINR